MSKTGTSSTSKENQELSTAAAPHGPPPIPSQARYRKIEEEDDDEPTPLGSNEEIVEKTASLNLSNADDDVFRKEPQKEPSSALEHFEKAVEKEEQGSLGDSLSLYRKAYRVNLRRLTWE